MELGVKRKGCRWMDWEGVESWVGLGEGLLGRGRGRDGMGGKVFLERWYKFGFYSVFWRLGW